MGNLVAKGERSVVVGRDAINSIIVAGDHNKVFVGKYETLRDAYVKPWEVFNRVDLDHFVGREWLVDMVDSFLENNDRGYFILEAGAGFGKTTFMAWLVHERSYIHNFCELTPGLENIGNALKNLSSQLALAYDLSTEGVLPTDAASRPDFLYDMLLKAAEKHRDKEKIVLVIDALDQAGTPKGQNVLGLPKSLPESVFIIVSQRPVEVTLTIDIAKTHREVCSLLKYKEKHEDDIRCFLYDATTRPKIIAFLQDRGYTPEKFVKSLMEKCQGVWVYLHFVIPEIESGECLTLDLDSLPEGLLNYYIEYWGRWREDDRYESYLPILAWYESYLPLLATLAVAQEPISIERLALWTNSKMPLQMLKRLLKERWQPYMVISLYGKEERYRFYHQTLKEFFEGKVELKYLDTSQKEAFIDELKEASFEAHNILVERYLTAWGGLNNGLLRLQNPEFLTIDDSYGLRYLAYHLEASGRVDELHRLLSLETTKQRNAWYEAKDAYGAVSDYMVDVARAWQLAESESASKIKIGEIAPTLSLEIRYALISSSINSLSANIPPELLVALVENEIWTLNKALAYARQIPELCQRVEALILIVLTLSQSLVQKSQKEELLKEALNTELKIRDESQKASALDDYRTWLIRVLAPHLPEYLMKEALYVIIRIQSEFERAYALPELAPYLPESMMEELLNIVNEIQDESLWAEALVGVTPNLPEPMMKYALDATSQIKNEYTRAEALSKLAPYLPESMRKVAIKEALEAAKQIQDECIRKDALSEIFPNLPESMIEEALNIITQFRSEYEKVSAVAVLAPHLPETMRMDAIKEAMDIARQIQNECGQAFALVELAPYLPEYMIKEALDKAIQVKDLEYRAQALIELAPYLPESMMKEALDATTQLEYESERAEVLAKIASNMPESMMKEALEIAIKIQDESARAEVLVELAQHLPESMRKEAIKEALEAAKQINEHRLTIQNEYQRTCALVEIFPYLPESMMKEALDATSQTQYEYERAKVLVEIFPYLPESMMKEALDVTFKINDNSYRAKVLAELVPHLPEPMRKKALIEALEVSIKIQDETPKARALVGLTIYLPELMREEKLIETLNEAIQIHDDLDRAKALVELAPHLPESMRKEAIEEALNAAIQIESKSYKVKLLALLAPHLPESMRKEAIEEALETAKEITSVYYRAKAFVRLTPHMPESMREETLETAVKIKSKSCRTEVLSEIAPYLPESMIKEELKAAIQLQDSFVRIKVLDRLIPYLPKSELSKSVREETLKEALDAASQILDESKRAEAFVRLAPHMSESKMKETLNEALEAATKIQDEYSRAEKLAEVALSTYASIFPLDLLHDTWMKILHGSTGRRSKLFTNIGKLELVIYKLGKDKALNETLYAIQDVAKWWP